MTPCQASCGATELSWRCCRGLMKFLEDWFDIKGMISILCWRICHEVVQAGFNPTSLLFACAIHCASRIFPSYGPIQRAAGRATFPSRVSATRCPNRLVPGRPRCTGSRGVHLPSGDCRGGPLDAEPFQPQG